MHLKKVIFLAALCPFIDAAPSVADKLAEFLRKPHVLPSAERHYHAVYHELDSEASSGANKPVFGQIYVALIEDQFTFGGDMENWEGSKFPNGNRNCKSFMGTNVFHLCDDDYFLVHQDMVKLQKTPFENRGNEPDLNTVCMSNNKGFRASDDNENHFVYRYKHRVLMTYKKSVDHIKCIGTYDVTTDTFTCMLNNKNTAQLEPLEVQHFLWDQDTGTFARKEGHVEVFCKQLHY